MKKHIKLIIAIIIIVVVIISLLITLIILNKKEEYKKYLDKAIELDPSLSNFDNEKRNLIIS